MPCSATLNPARTWRLRDAPSDVVRELEQELRLSPLVARLMALRGIDTPARGQEFLARRIEDLLWDIAPAQG